MELVLELERGHVEDLGQEMERGEVGIGKVGFELGDEQLELGRHQEQLDHLEHPNQHEEMCYQQLELGRHEEQLDHLEYPNQHEEMCYHKQLELGRHKEQLEHLEHDEHLGEK